MKNRTIPFLSILLPILIIVSYDVYIYVLLNRSCGMKYKREHREFEKIRNLGSKALIPLKLHTKFGNKQIRRNAIDALGFTRNKSAD